MLRIGHRGAAALAPENTIAAMRAVIAAGVDMVEFDVAPGLVVGHDGGRPAPAALSEFLAELAAIAPPELGFLVDLKGCGYERETLAACHDAGIADRCVFSTGEMPSLATLNDHARTSATVAPGRWVPWGQATPADVHARSGARDATLRHDIVTAETVTAVHERGGRVFAWTVNTRADIERMRALGCDGVITDDPRLFDER